MLETKIPVLLSRKNISPCSKSAVDMGKGAGDCRVVWPDILRIVAIFAVIMTHVTVGGFYGRFGARTSCWQICNIFFSLCRFCVPVFVMVSGLFLLSPAREYSIKKLFCVKILRIAIAYLFWTTMYAAFHVVEHWKMGMTDGFAHLFINDLLTVPDGHLWFMPMIIGLYIATPIVRVIVENEEITIYFLVIWFAFATMSMFEHIFPVKTIVLISPNRIDMKLVSGFSGYYILGYWLSRHLLSPVKRKVIYFMGFLAFLCTALLNGSVGYMIDYPGSWFHAFLYPNVILMSTAVFVFFQYSFQNRRISQKWQKLISSTAKWSFGVYLIHIIPLVLLAQAGISVSLCYPLVSIPATTIACFLVSYTIAFFLSKIPVINEYIV